MPEVFGSDAFSPKEIARKVELVGVTKARLPWFMMLTLSVIAGGFIGIGGMFYVLVKSDSTLGFAASSALGGAVFSIGLLLVVVAGAELFTGNNLLIMAWADRHISTAELLRNWATVLLGNLIGAVGFAVLVYLSGHTSMNDGAVSEKYVSIAAAKCTLPFGVAFVRGILCNVLVCLAVWMATAGRSVVDKFVAVMFPVAAFVAAGFEHSVANMYLFPVAMLVEAFGGGAGPHLVTWAGVGVNLVAVLLGNVIGGSVFVGLVYHFAYQRLCIIEPEG